LFISYSGLQLGVDYYIWGAQLVEGSVAKDYQKTETRLNIPRLDYSNGTCPSLLVEPQRTNNLLYSSSFDNAAWDKQGATVTANDTTAPDGTMTADKVVFSGANKTIRQALNMAGATITASVYIKGTAGQTIGIDDIFATQQVVTLTGEWQRVQFTAASPNGYGLGISTFGGVTATTIYLWGAQLEAGSYATSYIPTTSASVTRNADVISKTGISSLIGQTEGTLFFEIDAPNPNANGGLTMIQVGTGSSRIYIAKESSTQNIFQLATQSASGYNFINTANITTSTIKFAIAYKNGDNAFYVNGSLISTASATANPTSFSQLNFGDTTSGNTDTKIKAAALWETRLDNSTLATLTTL
jgi:hypothetical protein